MYPTTDDLRVPRSPLRPPGAGVTSPLPPPLSPLVRNALSEHQGLGFESSLQNEREQAELRALSAGLGFSTTLTSGDHAAPAAAFDGRLGGTTLANMQPAVSSQHQSHSHHGHVPGRAAAGGGQAQERFGLDAAPGYNDYHHAAAATIPSASASSSSYSQQPFPPGRTGAAFWGHQNQYNHGAGGHPAGRVVGPGAGSTTRTPSASAAAACTLAQLRAVFAEAISESVENARSFAEPHFQSDLQERLWRAFYSKYRDNLLRYVATSTSFIADIPGRELQPQTFLQHSHLHDSGRAVLLRRAAADVDAIEQEEAPAHIDNYNGSTEHASPSMDEIAQEALELEREEEVLDAEIARVCEQLASLVRRKRVQEVESVEEDRKKDVERSLEAISAAAGKDLAFLGEPLLIRTLPLNKGSEVGRGNSVGPTAAFAAG